MMDLNSKLDVMIWNAQGIQKKSHEFFYFLHENSIDISLVSETHLSSNDSCSHPDYFTYRLDRNDDCRGGGVAIFIKRNVKHRLLTCPQTQVIEALSIEVMVGSKKFNVFSVYFRGSKSAQVTRKFKADLASFMVNPNFLIGGDFNAKNVAWNCPSNNSAGKALQQLMDGEDILIHFPNSPTHFPQNGNRPSTIDLILTRGFPNPSTLATDDSLTSDHVPVLCSLELSVERIPEIRSFIKDFSRADWEGFRTSIDSNIGSYIELDLPDVTEEIIDDSVAN